MNQSEEDQHKAIEECLSGLKELGTVVLKFDQENKSNNHFLFNGEFGLADIALAPWWQRLNVVAAHYRGWVLPEGREFNRLNQWYKAVLQVPGYNRTIVKPERLIKNYTGYADNSATSDAAKKFRNSKL